ncbi:S8 family serine peptidase [Streptomyces sp. RKAG293]|uniref:S8 family serine peptidase n=1 Tax=Streptomyces sp. RKAG293 TaxID=2893403 RepID=UPI00203388DC|nr:S8 family serine peptidase [Streptomyces sp. RKAG293]MCM2423834.1 S8 family serine peptidase [Streptomyces sp. RKAG293]
MGSTSRARTAALAAAVAGTLITGTASAGTQPARAAGSTAQDGTTATAKASAAGTATVTLITGDRVVVGGNGRVVQLMRGKGRQGTVFSVRREGEHTYVIPQDALHMIGDGVLDRRLFDVAQLVKDEYDDAHRTTLPLIVGYRRDAAAAGALTAASDAFAGVAHERRPLPAVDGEAFNAPKSDATALWSVVSGGTNARTAGAAPVAPIAHLWLDAKVRAALDTSVPQIGAPTMWQAGYTGKGVKVAVLDSGVDQNHPDLKGVETAEKNFSSSPDSKDRFGHGTHVASIFAGSGAQSGGRYKGVAPGVQLLDGKVLDDSGFGDSSSIVSGMQWAVDQGAKVVNMSIGGGDDLDIDPMEEAIARLSGKALFVVSAGNTGNGAHTINSPGSAPAALTVGAVDKQDQFAPFSSCGPTATGESKPDLTAPGVDITAALTTENTEPSGNGYTTMSGTSMSAPHAAGAAALLFQQHPTWSGAQIKALLTGSAKPNPALNAYQQGAGRVDLTRAATAVVVSEPGSLAFGTQLWPHADDKPVAKSLTYRNYGAKAVTLRLSAAGTDPAGHPAPAGMFTVKDAVLTVPAGGSATTTVTVDTRKGTVDGAFGGGVLAAGDGQSVRTGLAVVREVESYELTLRHTDVNGAAPLSFYTTVTAVGGDLPARIDFPNNPTGVITQRLPKGDYQLESFVYSPDDRMAIFVQPVLKLSAKTTITLDSRKAKPFTVTAPDPAARLVSATVGYEDLAAGVSNSWVTDGQTQILTAALGPAGAQLHAQYSGVWKTPGAAGKNVDYRLVFPRKGSWFTGLTRKVTPAEVAEVKLGFGASVSGAKGLVWVNPTDENDYGVAVQDPDPQSLPLATTQYVSAAGLRWSWSALQVNAQGEGRIAYNEGPVAYQPATRHTLNFNTGVVGPELEAGNDQGALRSGDSIDTRIQLFNDGSGHSGSSVVTEGFTRLESGGRVIAEGSATDWLSAEVPAASAVYRLSMEASRSAEDTSTSTKVAAAWTFTSGRPPADRTVELPLSTVRFSPNLSLSGTAPGGGTLKVPLRLGGTAAAAGQVAALTVRVSFDGGTTWKPLTVTTDATGDRSVSVRHPATARTVSLQVDLKDKAGNTVRETITNAYRLAAVR